MLIFIIRLSSISSIKLLIRDPQAESSYQDRTFSCLLDLLHPKRWDTVRVGVDFLHWHFGAYVRIVQPAITRRALFKRGLGRMRVNEEPGQESRREERIGNYPTIVHWSRFCFAGTAEGFRLKSSGKAGDNAGKSGPCRRCGKCSYTARRALTRYSFSFLMLEQQFWEIGGHIPVTVPKLSRKMELRSTIREASTVWSRYRRFKAHQMAAIPRQKHGSSSTILGS